MMTNALAVLRVLILSIVSYYCATNGKVSIMRESIFRCIVRER